MSAPLKPWERVGVNNQNYGGPPVNSMSSELPLSTTGLLDGASSASPSITLRTPPTVPPRPSQQAGLSGYGGSGLGGDYGALYGGGYGGYGSYGSRLYGGYGGGYGSYGSSFGGYAGYGSSFNRFGQNNMNIAPNSFVRAAEESSRQAFQSVESIVQAFGSVAMMLESTFQAVYNSFQAVLGVADHFSRMKATFKQVFSALAIWRLVRWAYRKLLVLLRLRPAGLNDDVWASAMGPVGADVNGSPKKSNWPLMLFLAIALGGPWLIWKILSSVAGREEEENDWLSGNADHFVGVAEYDFQGQTNDELRFRNGQKITIAPKELQPRMRSWLLGTVDGKTKGIFPANHVKILGKQKGKKQTANKMVNQPISSQPALAPAQVPTHKDMNAVFESSSSSSFATNDSPVMNPAPSEFNTVFGENVAPVSSSESTDYKTAEDILEDKTDQK